MFSFLKLKSAKARIVGFAIVLLFLWLQTSPVAWLVQPIQRIEALAYDFRLNSTSDKNDIDPRVVIIDIDEKAYNRLGSGAGLVM